MIQFMISSLALPASAVTIDEIRRTLADLRGVTPIQATMDLTEENEAQQRKRIGRSRAEIEERNGTLQFTYPSEALSRAAARTAVSEDPGFARPDVVDAHTFLNYAPELIRDLSYATIARQTPTTWQGKPATLVEMKLEPPTSAEARRFVRSTETFLNLYVDPDGLPLSATRTSQVRGRVVLVPFQASSKLSSQFQRIGDRLVVVRHESQGTASGFGQEGSSKTITTITPRNGS
jgi:hypothetical protein